MASSVVLDYHTIVKKPMDLGTVKSKLSKICYKSPLEFAEDVRLTFNNAMLYNPAGHDVHRTAEFLLKMFEEKWTLIETQFESLNKRQQQQAPVSSTIHCVEPLPLQAPTPSPPPMIVEDRTLERSESMTKPVEPAALTVEEEACGNRVLTFEEKQRLSEDLQDLPFEKLEVVVQIIKKRNPELAQQDDEIELDTDSLDLQTLWGLYRFVTEYKESLSKKTDAESVHNKVQEPNTIVTGPESPNVGKLGHVASSPVRQAVNGGGSSISNSSISGSGSSSSDSDSDSSGNGPDVTN